MMSVMAMKFESESTKTRLVQETSTRSSCTTGDCGVKISDRPKFTTTDAGCHGNKI